MMDGQILTDKKMPFCPGCGYNASVRSIASALKKSGLSPKDVIMVSDIGCSGLVDPLFTTHTIHGLHGRSSALGLGISYGLNNPKKKVLVIQGDGGATIGMQHILEAARRNTNMTHIILNNMVYGMTGGQLSGLSGKEFKSLKNSRDQTPPFDICTLAKTAGARFVARRSDPKDFESALVTALTTRGFSLVELPSMCQPYGIKKLTDLKGFVNPDMEYKHEHNQEQAGEYGQIESKQTMSLFDRHIPVTAKYKPNAGDKTGIVIAGSAGGGVQAAARLLASAGIISGLSVTIKGEYPITVGTGFSIAEVILSKSEINYTGLEDPDVMIILTEEGMGKVRQKIGKRTTVIVDSVVDSSDIKTDKVMIQDFSKHEGKKGAALSAITYWLDTFSILPVEALSEVALRHKYGSKFISIIENSVKSHFFI